MQSRLLSALAFFPLACGCSELVDLGSECPPDVSVCLEGPVETTPPGVQPLPAAPLLDAGSAGTTDRLDERDARASDGGTLADGNGEGNGAAPALPALENRSFELTQGGPGDITTVSLPTFTSISPWYTCQAIGQGSTGPLSAVRAESALGASSVDAGAIGATDARTFVSIRYFGNVLQVPLIQRASSPLLRGTRYGFAVDVRATASATAHLSLQVKGGNDCLGITQQPEVLATTAPVQPGAWQRVCVSFVPSASYNLIGLQAVSTLPLSDDMLLVDNLREATDCP